MKMYRGSLEQLFERARQRPPGYLEDVLRHATVSDGTIEWTEEAHLKLLEKYNPDFLSYEEMMGFGSENLFRIRTGQRLPGQVDVVWMVGNGSTVNDWELRIGLRTFLRYYDADARFWVIGHVPKWLDRNLIRCIDWPDPYKRNKDANLLNKVVRLALEPELTDKFILCSDDHFLNKPSKPDDFQWWHLGEIGEPRPEDSNWQKRLKSTGEKLRQAGFPAFNFEGHIPYPLQKEWCREALRFDYGNGNGMTVFTTILNCARVEGQHLNSEPVRGWLGGMPTRAGIQIKSRHNRFLCLNGDSVKQLDCLAYFNERFSEPAPWELDAHEILTPHQ